MASLAGGTCVRSFWSWVAGGEGYRGRCCGWWNRLGEEWAEMKPCRRGRSQCKVQAVRRA